jgi:predicted TIM-barrel fold metal-dependent hydrolase
MIIDSHMHVWPDHIAAQVVAGRPTGLEPRFDGTLAGLLRTMDEAGIDMGLALGVANKASTVARTNEFIGQVPRDRLVPFGTVHPDLSVEENLRHLRDNGIRGVKLHPLFQSLSFTDPRVHEIAQGLADDDITVITHAGAGGTPEENERGNPAALRVLVEKVPELALIACHYGGYHLLDEAESELVGSTAYLETSWPPTMAELDPVRIRDLIRRHGADRVVFGSDWPMTDPAAEMAGIRALGLTDEETAGVLGGNLARLLGLPAVARG